MIGVLRKRGRFLVARPLFERNGKHVTLDGRGGSEGDIVLVGTGKRGARVVRKIGRPEVARDVIEALMLDRGLRRSFPRKVEAEAADPEVEVDAARNDLRDLATFTIDPDDAKDFDDAISAEKRDGFVRLWVHIADVSAYVRPGGAIDTEAYRRGTSTYVPGAVEPMLPEALSNRACSLRPGEDKLAVTVEIDIAGTEVRRVEFSRTMIRSDKRLTYGDVDRGVRGQGPGRGPVGRAAGRRARGLRRAGRPPQGARRAGGELAGADVRVRLRRERDRRPPRGPDRVAHPDRGAHDPRQRAGGRLPGRSQAALALPGAREARSPGRGADGGPARLAGHPHAGGARRT